MHARFKSKRDAQGLRRFFFLSMKLIVAVKAKENGTLHQFFFFCLFFKGKGGEGGKEVS